MKECSDIGLSMITKGGNAVDAAVAAMFCMGVVNAESSGLGGYEVALDLLTIFKILICQNLLFAEFSQFQCGTNKCVHFVI